MIPTWKSVDEKSRMVDLNSLEDFIWEFEPGDESKSRRFRKKLKTLLNAGKFKPPPQKITEWDVRKIVDLNRFPGEQ